LGGEIGEKMSTGGGLKKGARLWLQNKRGPKDGRLTPPEETHKAGPKVGDGGRSNFPGEETGMGALPRVPQAH